MHMDPGSGCGRDTCKSAGMVEVLVGDQDIAEILRRTTERADASQHAAWVQERCPGVDQRELVSSAVDEVRVDPVEVDAHAASDNEFRH